MRNNGHDRGGLRWYVKKTLFGAVARAKACQNRAVYCGKWAAMGLHRSVDEQLTQARRPGTGRSWRNCATATCICHRDGSTVCNTLVTLAWFRGFCTARICRTSGRHTERVTLRDALPVGGSVAVFPVAPDLGMGSSGACSVGLRLGLSRARSWVLSLPWLN